MPMSGTQRCNVYDGAKLIALLSFDAGAWKLPGATASSAARTRSD